MFPSLLQHTESTNPRTDMVKLKEFLIILSGTQVHNPGSLIEGCVVLELSAPQNYKCISIVISGKAQVEWSAISGSHSTEISLIPNAGSGIRLLGNGRDLQQVGGGWHEFPFSFQLPRSLPSSYKGKIRHFLGCGNCKGSIRYSLTAALSRPWLPKRYVEKTIIIEDIVRINHVNTAVSSSNWAINPVRISAITDRGGYYPGESIAFTVTVHNNGSGRIKAVQATLMQKVVYGKGRSGTRLIHEDRQRISLLKGPGTGPEGEINWNDRMLIPVDTVPNIYNCRIIHLSYILIVETVGTRSDSVSVDMPIVIGTRPFHEQTTMGSTNANRSLATTSGSRPVQVEQLSTNAFQWFGTNQGSMSLERNYPASRNEFLGDQREWPGTHTFQYSLRNPSSQREHSGMRDPPPPYTARSISFSHFGSSVSQTPATNSEHVSFQRERIYPPLNIGNDQEMRENAFAPMSDSVTNLDQPPPYDSLVTGVYAHT